MNVIPREKGHWLIYGEAKVLVVRVPGSGNGEREPLPFLPYGAIHAIAEWFVEVNRPWTRPEEAKGSVRHFEEQVQILDRGVVNTIGRSDAGFSRPTKDLAQDTVSESRRVSQTEAWGEVLESGRSKRLRDARVAWIYEPCRRMRKNG
jgi:hypothetical protein